LTIIPTIRREAYRFWPKEGNNHPEYSIIERIERLPQSRNKRRRYSDRNTATPRPDRGFIHKYSEERKDKMRIRTPSNSEIHTKPGAAGGMQSQIVHLLR
jgi:hypothetical protein